VATKENRNQEGLFCIKAFIKSIKIRSQRKLLVDGGGDERSLCQSDLVHINRRVGIDDC
jgi:hypothetical protein